MDTYTVKEISNNGSKAVRVCQMNEQERQAQIKWEYNNTIRHTAESIIQGEYFQSLADFSRKYHQLLDEVAFARITIKSAPDTRKRHKSLIRSISKEIASLLKSGDIENISRAKELCDNLAGIYANLAGLSPRVHDARETVMQRRIDVKFHKDTLNMIARIITK